MLNFEELSEFCIKRYKNSLSSENESYVKTLYVAISEDNEVYCSTTPHILSKAHRCILIHSRSALAVSNWYTWYTLEYIDKDGSVTGGFLGNGFSIYTDWVGSWSNQRMYLKHEDLEIYSCPAPFEDKMQKVWDLYQRVKKAKSNAEIELIAEMIEKDETILEQEKEIASLKFTNKLLEKQKKQYKNLLDDIKVLVRK